MKESTLQKQVVKWCKWQSGKYPALEYVFSHPNEGKRNRYKGWKAMGMVSGIPDLVLPVASGPFGHLYVELKTPGNDITENQQASIQMLIEAGNAVDVAWTFEQAQFVFLHYLRSPDSFLSGY